MIKWKKAELTEQLQSDEAKELWWVVDEEGTRRKALAYVNLIGKLGLGEQVWINVTATSLGLGTGGVDFIVAKVNASDDIQTKLPHGHIMKLRYTPYQLCVQAVEEQDSEHHAVMKDATSLEGMVTLIGELHSMLPILSGVINEQVNNTGRSCNIVYIMTDGAALPLTFSENVKKLKEIGWINKTISCGHAFGGDVEAVNIYSALLAAKHVLKADIAIVLMGPGTVGTGTVFGTTSIEFGTVINAVHSLDGVAVGVPRISFADQRERHRGISHHTITSLGKVALAEANVGLPTLAEEEQNAWLRHQVTLHNIGQKHNVHFRNSITVQKLNEILAAFPGKVTTMGRGIEQEEAFFLAAGESAMLAWELWHHTLN